MEETLKICEKAERNQREITLERAAQGQTLWLNVLLTDYIPQLFTAQKRES